MTELLKNLLYRNNKKCLRKHNQLILVMLCFLTIAKSQVNQVGNPSFENVVNCSGTNYLSKALYWNSIDSVKLGYGGEYLSTCYLYVPNNAAGHQFPRTGNAYIRTTVYCTTTTCVYPFLRTYPKNRLLNSLTAGKSYCVKFFINLTNTSPYGISNLDVHLGDATIDTIKYCGIPLTYLTPQVTNTVGIITDTLNWVEVSGTFTANGNEKYLIIGDFKSDVSTNSFYYNTNGFPGVGSEYYIDDVSVIDYNLPAYAGPDKNINLGDSAFIGRPPEIGLECTWTTGTTTVGGGGGIWVKPTSLGTFSYVVTQNICGNIKTDTVFINMSSGINENIAFANSIGIYPQPAKDVINISLNNFYEPIIEIKITDVTGKTIREESLTVRNGKTQIETSEFSNGVYILQLISKNQIAQKRLIIAR